MKKKPKGIRAKLRERDKQWDRTVIILQKDLDNVRSDRENLRKELVSASMEHAATKHKLFELGTRLEKSERVLTAIRAISDPLKLDFSVDIRISPDQVNLQAMIPTKGEERI